MFFLCKFDIIIFNDKIVFIVKQQGSYGYKWFELLWKYGGLVGLNFYINGEMMKKVTLIATCAFGLEAIVKREIIKLGFDDINV